MAFAPIVARSLYENLSVEQLEAKYESLKHNYCFNTKEEQIEYIIKNYLNSSNDVNNRSIKIALEELLKEKTGKEYSIQPKTFDISLVDIINYVTKTNEDPFWQEALTNYFEKLEGISEQEKIDFLIKLIQDENSYNEFTKEILHTENVFELYNKYNEILEKFILMNMREC